jgi:hypothetical protein
MNEQTRTAMRTKHILLVGCTMLATNGILAQAWDEGGNTITNLTKYVGCDANSTVPLKVMHNANQPIE